MSALPSYWISHSSCRLHRMEPGHPECPERLAAVEDRVMASGLDLFLHRLDAPAATADALLRVHGAEHVEAVLRTRPSEGLVHIDPDTSMNPHTADAALHAAGAGVLAVDLLMSRRAGFVFCNVRPPGHHAERNRAMGFCFFNNIAVAAAEALSRGLSRVAILDFDVHYGNGTADIFRNEPRVLMCSTYQHPLYPYSGGVPKGENMVNLPIPPYTRGMEIRDMIEAMWMPRLEAFKPQMIVISAGFDAHREDDLGQLGLVEADYEWITRRVKDIADRHAGGRIVSCLEGGYALGALGRSVAAHLRRVLRRCIARFAGHR